MPGTRAHVLSCPRGRRGLSHGECKRYGARLLDVVTGPARLLVRCVSEPPRLHGRGYGSLHSTFHQLQAPALPASLPQPALCPACPQPVWFRVWVSKGFLWSLRLSKLINLSDVVSSSVN